MMIERESLVSASRRRVARGLVVGCFLAALVTWFGPSVVIAGYDSLSFCEDEGAAPQSFWSSPDRDTRFSDGGFLYPESGTSAVTHHVNPWTQQVTCSYQNRAGEVVDQHYGTPVIFVVITVFFLVVGVLEAMMYRLGGPGGERRFLTS